VIHNVLGLRVLSNYRQDARSATCRYCFYSRVDFGFFFAPHGRHVAPIKVKFGRKERTLRPLLPAKFHLDRLRGVGLRPKKTLKIWNFTNIIAPKGRVPFTILTKFTGFMCVLSLH